MSSEFQSLLESFRQLLGAEMRRWLAERRRKTEQEAPEAVIMLDRLQALLAAGGKRLRPALIYFSYLGNGGDSQSQVLPLAMASELLHTYLLVHDDIMDHAATRRGETTAHVFFSEHHRQQGWSGDSDEHGLAMAILVGDLAQTLAMELFASCRPPEDRAVALNKTFFRMCREVIDGQYLEMQLGLGGDPKEEDLRRVLRLKSGLYSVERPVQLGALLAGTDEATFEALSRYGLAVGEAFQLQDDLLGVFGDPAATGKPVGGDLLEGKFTFVIHAALERLSQADGQRLRQLLGRTDAAPEEVAAIVELLRRCGAETAVREMIAQRSDRARSDLAGLTLAPAGREFLHGLVGYLEERRS